LNHDLRDSAIRTSKAFPKRNRLAKVLLLHIMIFSSVVTLCLTVIQLYIDYQDEKAQINRRLDEIEQSYSTVLAGSLWVMDRASLDNQLNSILKLPSVRMAEVKETGTSLSPLTVTAGRPENQNILSRDVILRCCGDNAEEIGVFRIQATLEDIYRNLIFRAAVIFTTLGAKTLLVASFIFFVVHRRITRHLLDIAAAAVDYDPRRSSPLRLDRPKPETMDELDHVVAAINNRNETLKSTIETLNQSNSALERLNRVLRTQSQGNEALIRASGEEELFATMCRVIVETGGYRMACVAIVEHDPAKTIRPVACSGHEEGYLTTSFFSWDENNAWGCGPAGLCVRSGRHQILVDIETEKGMAPWKAPANARGYRSMIALPLKTDKNIFGILAIYAAEANAFREPETALLIDLANNLSYGVNALRAQKRHEETATRLRQAEKMEVLGKMAGSVAHDFNNLLGAILGFARFISEDSDDDTQIHHYAHRITTAGQRGKALIGQILSFARHGEVKRERVPLSRFLDDIRILMNASIPSSTMIVVQCDLPDAEIKGDPDQLTQVLLNLCLNAHDTFAGRPGTIALTLKPTDMDDIALGRLRKRREGETPKTVEVWEDQTGAAHAVTGILNRTVKNVSLTVSDTGCGMDGALLEQIFTPFFTTKAKGKGTGLGLAVVHSVVVAHNGALSVSSRVGEGTRFELILPLFEGQAPVEIGKPSSHPLRSAVATGRIFVVDDDRDFGAMLKIGLERLGFEITSSNNPLEALTVLRADPGRWDAVISDFTMPNMNGIDLIREVKTIRPDLPCVLCSGNETYTREAKRAESGVFAFFSKPVDLDRIADTLARAIR